MAPKKWRLKGDPGTKMRTGRLFLSRLAELVDAAADDRLRARRDHRRSHQDSPRPNLRGRRLGVRRRELR
ncbi:hypothetical protein MTO96_002184 [Rhipicephalus appendiculatus]